MARKMKPQEVAPSWDEELLALAIVRLDLDSKMRDDDYPHEEAKCGFRHRSFVYIAEAEWATEDGICQIAIKVSSIDPQTKELKEELTRYTKVKVGNEDS